MQLDKAIQSRKSVKEYSNKIPDWRDIIECIDAARYAPMAGNDFTLKFIVINDQEKIQELADCAQQPHVANASYVVVACSDPTRTMNAFGERGEIYTRQQAGAAIQNFLLKLEEKGLVTVWTGHFVDEMVKTVLRIPPNAFIEAIFPIGYPSKLKGKPPRKKDKIEMDRILFFNQWGNRKMKHQRKYDV